MEEEITLHGYVVGAKNVLDSFEKFTMQISSYSAKQKQSTREWQRDFIRYINLLSELND